MDPHGSSWLLKRKRTLLSKSFQPIRTGTERNERESGEEHDTAKTPRVRRAGHTEDVT